LLPEILADPKFGSQTIAKFINHAMSDGKNLMLSVPFYGALETVSQKT
jgi:small subunit ribosomal protein S7